METQEFNNFDLKTAVNIAVKNAEQEQKDVPSVIMSVLDPAALKARMGAQQVAYAFLVMSSPLTSEEYDFECNRLAEGYALQGNFEAAINNTRDDKQRENYVTILQAIENPVQCDCPAIIGQGQGRVKTQFVTEVFLHNGQDTKLMRCALCGNLWT